jgi:hypothetical protein
MTKVAEESFSVEYHGNPVIFFAMRGKGWRYQCPLKCCNAWHWIETASGGRHRIVSAAKEPVSIVASLKCPCYKGCTWHVVITDGIARDA